MLTKRTALITLLCCAQLAQAAEADTTQAPAEVQSVTVSGVKDPEIKSYRALVSGLDAFDKYRRLAPHAPELRFRLSSVSDTAAVDFNNLVLHLRGDSTSIPVPVFADGTFLLPRNKEAENDNADLFLNQTRGRLRGRPEVRTPGVPENARRLGDLRLECEVYFAIAKHEMNMLQRAAMATATLGAGPCQSKKMHMGFPASNTITALTLVSGDRRVALKPGMPNFSGRHFFPPNGDRDWPDDTLLEFQFGSSDAQAVDKPN